MSDDLSIPNSAYRGTPAGRYGAGRNRLRQRMHPDTRRLVMFAGSVGTVLAVLIGISTLTGRHSGQVPVVIADGRPLREKPVNPGGMKIEAAENDVFSAGTDTSDARLAPAPESPNAKALRPPPPPTLAPPGLTAAPAETTAPMTAEPPPAPVVRPDVAAAVPTTPRPLAAKQQVAAVEPHAPTPAKPTAEAHAPAQARQTATAEARALAQARPTVIAEARPPASAKPTVAAEAHATESGRQPMVQLAALTSEAAAHTEWAQLAKKMPELLGGRQPTYQQAEHDGHTFWRVRTTGFADLAQARSFCERIRAKSAACSVTEF